VGREGCEGIVSLEQRGKKGGKGREWGNCVLTAVCVWGLAEGWEGKGVGELCVDCKFC